VAGSGRQTLTGGKGADVFVIAKAGTQATITDFKVGVDTLDLSALAATSWHDLGLRNDHGNAVISDGGSQITLQGVNVASLHPADITLHS
jgi:Ca2+-binding RTX toxin-like protein